LKYPRQIPERVSGQMYTRMQSYEMVRACVFGLHLIWNLHAAYLWRRRIHILEVEPQSMTESSVRVLYVCCTTTRPPARELWYRSSGTNVCRSETKAHDRPATVPLGVRQNQNSSVSGRRHYGLRSAKNISRTDRRI